MRVVCQTNLDEYKFKDWPDEMINPRVGDKVQSKTDQHILKIVSITHAQNIGGAYLIIELWR